MNSLFEIGQKVVCVDSRGRYRATNLIEGKVYTVLGIKKAPCCGAIVIDVGVSFVGYSYTVCTECGADRPPDGYKLQTRFVPLDFDRQADEAIHKALNEDLKVKNFQDN